MVESKRARDRAGAEQRRKREKEKAKVTLMAELGEQSLHPAQAQINKFGVERMETLHNRFSAGQGNYSAGAVAASASSSLRSSSG